MAGRRQGRARSAVFAPLGDPGRALRVEQRLGDAIRSGLLADGERLPSEPELAQMLGVATVTAREALVALRAQGLVTTVRGRRGGSFVHRPQHPDDSTLTTRLVAMSRVELHDRGTLHAVLLAGCAELAAERSDKGDAEDLRDLVVAADEPDVGRWRHADGELHLALAALTQSARMTREVARVEADFGALLRLPMAEHAVRSAARERQLAVIAAVEAADPDAARARMRDHVDAALAALADLHAAVG